MQKPGSSKSSTPYEKAKELFMNGVWAEKNGLVYEGIEIIVTTSNIYILALKM